MIYEPSNTLTDKFARLVRPLRQRRIIEFKLERPIISISFDDFPKSAIDNGARMLEAQGWRGTFYACASFAGITNHHGKQFSASDLPALDALGHEIASHTHDHIDCTSVSEETLQDQITRNSKALAEMGVKTPLDGFAYPFGALNAPIKGVIGKQFKTVRGITQGVHYDRADLNEVKSTGLYSSTYKKVLADIASLSVQKGWYTIFTHDICEKPTEWGCTPVEFNGVLEAAKEIGAIVLPIRDAVKYLETKNV